MIPANREPPPPKGAPGPQGREVNTTAGIGQARVDEPGPGPDQTRELHGAGPPVDPSVEPPPDPAQGDERDAPDTA